MVASTIVPSRRQPLRRQVLADLGQQPLAQLVLFQQVPEMEDRRLVGPRAPRRQPHEPLHRHAVVEHVFHRRVAEVVEQLHAVNPQQQGQRVRRPPALAGGVHRADARFEPRPRHQRLHALQKALPPRLARLSLVLHIGKCALRRHPVPHRRSVACEHKPCRRQRTSSEVS